MAHFKLPAETSTLRNALKTIEYTKDTHQEIFQQLKNVITKLDQSSDLKELKNSIMLGAALFTQARISGEYTVGSPEGSMFNKGSELFQSISSIALITELNSPEIDSAEQAVVKAFAIRSFYQWYQGATFADGERLDKNPLCDNEKSYQTLEKELNKMAKDLAPIDPTIYLTIRRNGRLIIDAGYDPSAKVESQEEIKKPEQSQGRVWGVMKMFTYFTQPSEDAKKSATDKLEQAQQHTI